MVNKPTSKNIDGIVNAEVKLLSVPKRFWADCLQEHRGLFKYNPVMSCKLSIDVSGKKEIVYDCGECGGSYSRELILGKNHYRIVMFGDEYVTLDGVK